MPQACVPRSVERALSKWTCNQLVPHVGSQILHLKTCLDVHPLLGFVEQKAMAALETSLY